MKVDVSSYLVVGRENTLNRPIEDIVEAAVLAGFTCIQIRSKCESALELIEDCRKAAAVIAKLHKENSVALLVDDRLDVVLACRDECIKVDGIHVGQSDIPVSVCRKYLGKDAIVGLSAPTKDLIDYVKNAPKDLLSCIDYFGAGPVHETNTKLDCAVDNNGVVITKTFDELSRLAEISPLPVVVGGGVKLADIKALKNCAVAGFFVVSAVASAENPCEAAKELRAAWVE